jgi:hypothetical protein
MVQIKEARRQATEKRIEASLDADDGTQRLAATTPSTRAPTRMSGTPMLGFLEPFSRS